MITYSGTLAGSDGSSLSITDAVLSGAPVVDPPYDPPVESGSCLFGAGGAGVADGSLARQLASGRVDAASTWADSIGNSIAQSTIRDDPSKPGEYRLWNKVLDLAVGGMFAKSNIPGTQEKQSWQAAANGRLDGQWRNILNGIKSGWLPRNFSLLRIRFCHEFNGDWYEWTVRQGDIENYKKAFARFVALQREILPGALVVWPLNDDTTVGYDVMRAYPGDEWVDLFGIDGYNQWSHVKTYDAFWSKMRSAKGDGSPRGFEAWRLKAKEHGKGMCIPEWANNGQSKNTAAQGGGGESPLFVDEMHSWLTANGGTGAGRIEYANLFNLYTQYQLWPSTIQPETWRAYKAKF